MNGDEDLFTRRLIDLVYRRGHQVYVHTTGEQQARQLDDQLWIFRPDAFVPHVLHDSEHQAPIRIGFDHEPEDHQDVLVNLSGDILISFLALIGLQRWSLSTKIAASQRARITPTTRNEATS